MRDEWLTAVRERLRRFEGGDSAAVLESGALRELAKLIAETPDAHRHVILLRSAVELFLARVLAAPDDEDETDFLALIAFLDPLSRTWGGRLDARLRELSGELEPRWVGLIPKGARLRWVARALQRAGETDPETREAAEEVARAAEAVPFAGDAADLREWARTRRRELRKPRRTWQRELQALDEDLAAGRLSADDYRVRRDQVFSGPVLRPPGGSVWIRFPGPDADSPQRPEPVQPLGGPGRVPPGQQFGAADGYVPPVAEPADTGSVPVPAVNHRPVPADPEPEPAPRFLVGDMPSRAPLGADVSVVVRVAARSSGWRAPWKRIDRLVVPENGAPVSILVQAPPELVPVTALEQVLLVPQKGDSEPVRFGFRSAAPGLHRVRVLAFAGGTALAELELEVSVEPGGPSVDGSPVSAAVEDVTARRGEVTLQVRTGPDGTVFQLLSDAYLFEPVLAQAVIGDAAPEVERTIATLKQLAQGRGPYSGAMAAKWMREHGVGLWNGLVPATIKEQFWQLHGQITSFTIATSHDVVPWELLYPLAPGRDTGFLVEQFPVLRRVFGQHRAHLVSLGPCTCVVSARPPANSDAEIDLVRALLGDGGVVGDLDRLLAIIDSGSCAALHFACHNTFSPGTGSSIDLSGGPFVPSLLNSATVQRSLAKNSPLVFLNACRTAGSVPEYTRMTGWAQQFMASGAGAFIGTLWPVRSDSASAFATDFYERLRGGDSLGAAVLHARQGAVRDGPDPTWLAYTVYGDPHATARAV